MTTKKQEREERWESILQKIKEGCSPFDDPWNDPYVIVERGSLDGWMPYKQYSASLRAMAKKYPNVVRQEKDCYGGVVWYVDTSDVASWDEQEYIFDYGWKRCDLNPDKSNYERRMFNDMIGMSERYTGGNHFDGKINILHVYRLDSDPPLVDGMFLVASNFDEVQYHVSLHEIHQIYFVRWEDVNAKIIRNTVFTVNSQRLHPGEYYVDCPCMGNLPIDIGPYWKYIHLIPETISTHRVAYSDLSKFERDYLPYNPVRLENNQDIF
jgi:hypothetical protein